MPTTIDLENAKQIRQPMDVLITMQVPDDDISLTFSGYTSTAKVADGVLAQKSWPMRTLADLQGDGFSLGGSAVLYDPNTSASATNGKLGVRGNIGQPVSLTVTGDQMITGLTLLVTGAESVTYNGGTHTVNAGRVSFLVGATSASLTLTPSAADTRIQVSFVETGSEIRITNENLISCIVSLRSDLSPFDQTLPESELNIEAYDDVDVSAAVANIPEDTPIIYTAGYDNDMSPSRSFYVSGQITWADNILSIHAVDAVHFLDDVEVPAPITEEDSDFLLNASRHFLDKAGVKYEDYANAGWWSRAQRWIIKEGTKARDFIAFFNQCANITDENGNLLDGSGKLHAPLAFSYVDAGAPIIRTHSHNYWSIQESDCADVKRDIERLPGAVSAEVLRITNPGMQEGDAYAQKVGSAVITKNVGTSLSFDKYTFFWLIGLFLGNTADNDVAKKMKSKYGTVYGLYRTMPIVPANSSGGYYGLAPNAGSNYAVGLKLANGAIPQGEFGDDRDIEAVKNYSTFVPWSQQYSGWEYDNNPSHLIRTSAQMWNVMTAAGVIGASDQSIDLDIYGCAFNLEADTYANRINDVGAEYVYADLPIIGRVAARIYNGPATLIYPSRMLSVGMYRSPVTGSFTWKGDPRMQPRDVVNFHRLDGTVEKITIETITLKHEGGGTTAEITYRKGVV